MISFVRFRELRLCDYNYYYLILDLPFILYSLIIVSCKDDFVLHFFRLYIFGILLLL